MLCLYSVIDFIYNLSESKSEILDRLSCSLFANTEQFQTFFVSYPACCYFSFYVYFGACLQRWTLRDSGDLEKNPINSLRELADSTTHFKF